MTGASDTGICRTCLAPIWNEGGTVGHQQRTEGWSDRIERGGDSLVCFKAIGYRHVPLIGREAVIYDTAHARGRAGAERAASYVKGEVVTAMETQGAELLREAARVMRERAEAATPVPWRAEELPWRGNCVTGGASDFGLDIAGHVRTRMDNKHIASWHPGVALAVAKLLETVAVEIDPAEASRGEAEAWDAAYALARAYLGRES